MKRLKLRGKQILLVVLIVFLASTTIFCLGNAKVAASAETGAEPPKENVQEIPTDETAQELLDSFIAQLKAKYGDDYEMYLNAILSEWGSVEDYLLSLAGERTDPAANGWRKFVGWLSDNAPIWAPAVAGIGLIILIICGKKAMNKLLAWLNSKKKTVYKGMNKLYEAQYALGAAVLKQLGNGPQTENERKALVAAMQKLQEEDIDGEV